MLAALPGRQSYPRIECLGNVTPSSDVFGIIQHEAPTQITATLRNDNAALDCPYKQGKSIRNQTAAYMQYETRTL